MAPQPLDAERAQGAGQRRRQRRVQLAEPLPGRRQADHRCQLRAEAGVGLEAVYDVGDGGAGHDGHEPHLTAWFALGRRRRRTPTPAVT